METVPDWSGLSSLGYSVFSSITKSRFGVYRILGGEINVESRDRVLKCIARQPTDRVPIRMTAEAQTYEVIQQHLGLPDREAVWRRFGVDFREVARTRRNPCDEETSSATRTVTTSTGVIHTFTVNPPLAALSTPQELDSYSWESIEQWDWSSITEQAATMEHDSSFFLMYKVGCLFTEACELCGMTKFLTDIALNASFANRLLRILTDRIMEDIERAGAAGSDCIDTINLSDDLGGQQSLILSPDM